MARNVKLTRLKQWIKICRGLFILFAILAVYSLLPREEMTMLASGGLFWLIFAVVFGVQLVSLRLIYDVLTNQET